VPSRPGSTPKKEQPQVTGLRLLELSEADGIRTRNPRIDSQGPPIRLIVK